MLSLNSMVTQQKYTCKPRGTFRGHFWSFLSLSRSRRAEDIVVVSTVCPSVCPYIQYRRHGWQYTRFWYSHWRHHEHESYWIIVSLQQYLHLNWHFNFCSILRWMHDRLLIDFTTFQTTVFHVTDYHFIQPLLLPWKCVHMIIIWQWHFFFYFVWRLCAKDLVTD